MAACLTLFFSTAAAGQGGAVNSIGDIFEKFLQSLEDIGTSTEQMVPPRGGFGPDSIIRFDDRVVSSDTEDHTFPTASDVAFSIDHRFGEVHIESWERDAVNIHVDIMAGADTPDLAQDVLESIRIEIDAEDPRRITVRSVYPELPDYPIVFEIKFSIKVPANARIECDTTICDTIVRNVNGPVTIKAQLGNVDLLNIGGPVEVSAGERVTARDLRTGGVFNLREAEADFSNIAGRLRVDNHRGTTHVRDVSQANPVEITTWSGPLHFYLGEAANPDLQATAVFGDIVSDIALVRSDISNSVVARLPSGAVGGQSIVLETRFADLHIHGPGNAGPAAVPQGPQSESMREFIQPALRVAPATTLNVTAIPGNIVIEGADTDAVTVTGNLLVRMSAAGQAAAALDTLAIEVMPALDGGLNVTTRAKGDMAALGCTYYRIDLRIQCPRDMVVKLAAERGESRITGLMAAVDADQAWGSLDIESVEGQLLLRNQRGNVTVTRSTGPATVTAKNGEVLLEGVRLAQTVVGENCTVIIDAPQDAVTVGNANGDVRILALDGITGPYDISVRSGDINLLRTDDADVDFVVTVENGSFHHTLPIDFVGTFGAERDEARGSQNAGIFPVRLNARNGDVVIE